MNATKWLWTTRAWVLAAAVAVLAMGCEASREASPTDRFNNGSPFVDGVRYKNADHAAKVREAQSLLHDTNERLRTGDYHP